MKSKAYKEIFKLKRMLEKSGIPFDFIDRSINIDRLELRVDSLKKLTEMLFPEGKPEGFMEHYQICYPAKGEEQWISVIEGFGTHGGEQDKLEILGGFTPWEQYSNEGNPIGYLTANNVYKRIHRHWHDYIIKELTKPEKEENK